MAVAQLVEQCAEDARVAGSIPARHTKLKGLAIPNKQCRYSTGTTRLFKMDYGAAWSGRLPVTQYKQVGSNPI